MSDFALVHALARAVHKELEHEPIEFIPALKVSDTAPRIFPLASSCNPVSMFPGRFHPLLVHLPIAGLVLLGFLELLATPGLTLLARGRGQETRPGAGVPLMQQPVFAGVIEPILRRRCVACHSATKHKADLRLDTFEALLQGGQNGPVLKPGQAKDSSLIQRMLVPLGGDGHMPPDEEPQATAQEIALLEWWVNSGALADEKLVDVKPEPQIRRLLEMVSRREESAREQDESQRSE